MLQMCTLAAAVNVYIYIIYDSMIYLYNIRIMYINIYMYSINVYRCYTSKKLWSKMVSFETILAWIQL